ncbi:MAG: DUF3793 family protein [Anaerotignaceae bacterium]
MSTFENLLIVHCAPTLLGIKQANLFSCPIEKQQEFLSELDKYNILLNPKDIFFKVLYTCKSRLFIITYRKQPMLKSLKSRKVERFLKSIGYPLTSLENSLDFLGNRITGCDEFPHEIGFFLGYPTDDVFEFIKHKGLNFKFCGFWKVYSNENEAKKLFSQYRKCRALLIKKAETGMPLEKLLGVA